MNGDSTYPALERLKQEADGLDVLIEVAPVWMEDFIEYVGEMDYLERKREILEKRDTVRQRYTKGKEQVESTYGTIVNRALNRRLDGEQPSLDTERLQSELNDAKQAIDELRADLDSEYLRTEERRVLQELEEDIFDAREYARTKARFDDEKAGLLEEIAAFERRFEPYRERDRYMISSDEAYLTEQSKVVWRGLADLSRALALHVLPDDDGAWLGEQKSRFNELVDAIPEYNESFVEDEMSEHADVLTSEHGPLNDRQKKAVIRNDRRNLVDASAGTGKTLTLTHRFLYLLEKGVRPQRIVAITYMGDAAGEMKSRIAEESGLREASLNISTIHSFARKICMDAAGGGASDRDIGEAREKLVERYVRAAMNDETPDPNRYPDVYERFSDAFQSFRELDQEKGYIDDVRPFNTRWEEFTRETLEEFLENARTFELSPSDVRANVSKDHAVGYRFGRAAAHLLEAYERTVADESTPTDFEDMIRTARRIVESNPERFGREYDHVLVDEYQDVSESTLEFIDALVGASEDTHLFCVGDDWQSIMGFAGSNVSYFTEFESRYEDVTYTSLKTNYRCPPQVVEAGTELIEQSRADQNEKDVEAAADEAAFDDERTMQLHLLERLYESRAATYAADRVQQAIGDGHSCDEIMVLSRNDENSKYMSELRAELEERRIPHTRPDYERDYIPAPVEESFDRAVTYTEKGEAEFEDSDDEPPMVMLQSAHSAKGTESPVVIFLHAVGNDPDGIPIEEQTDPLLKPSMDITAEHNPEERRLFYVALTRAEEQFQAIAKPGAESRFITDIEEWFTTYRSNPEIRGECIEVNPPQHEKQPIEATLDCGSFEADLVAWPNNDPPDLDVGETYRIRDPVVNNSDYGEEIRYDKSTIESVS